MAKILLPWYRQHELVESLHALLVCVIIRLLVFKSMTPRRSLYIQSPIESMAAVNVFDIASFENSLSKYV